MISQMILMSSSCQRWRGCHFADALSPSLLIRPLTVKKGGGQNDSLADGYLTSTFRNTALPLNSFAIRLLHRSDAIRSGTRAPPVENARHRTANRTAEGGRAGEGLCYYAGAIIRHGPHECEKKSTTTGRPSHWRDCHFDDAFSPALLKRRLKVEGGAAE